MHQEEIPLKHSPATGYVLPLGPVNMVWAVARAGLVGCGAIDVAALGRFGYPAARAGPGQGSAITDLRDLLSGVIREVNPQAGLLGVRIGMSGREALDLLS